MYQVQDVAARGVIDFRPASPRADCGSALLCTPVYTWVHVFQERLFTDRRCRCRYRHRDPCQYRCRCRYRLPVPVRYRSVPRRTTTAKACRPGMSPLAVRTRERHRAWGRDDDVDDVWMMPRVLYHCRPVLERGTFLMLTRTDGSRASPDIAGVDLSKLLTRQVPRHLQAWLTINRLGLSTPARASAHASRKDLACIVSRPYQNLS